MIQHDLIFHGRLNINYHERLERFYGQWLSWTAFTSLIFSSAAFAALGNFLPSSWQPHREAIVAVLAFIIAFLNGGVLAFGMRTRLSTHTELKKKWITFLGQAQGDLDNTKLAAVERQFHELNAQEPAANQRWLRQAYRDTCRNLGLKPVQPV